MALYAEIIEIIAPEKAAPASPVNIEIRIRNNHSLGIGIMAAAWLETGLQPLPVAMAESAANVEAGEINTFRGRFTMPEGDVGLRAVSYWHGANGYWHADDEVIKAVKGDSGQFAAAASGDFAGFAVSSLTRL